MIRATVFVDWDSARRLVKPKWGVNDKVPLNKLAMHVEACFSELQSRIADSIIGMKFKEPVTITKSRIYHGWHRGKTGTIDRAAWEEASPKFRSKTTDRVSYLPDITYGNELLCGGKRSTLFDTLREREPGVIEQKMVDTALTSDLLWYCRMEGRNVGRGIAPPALALIVGDDDDLIPGAIVSEAWGIPTRVLRVGREIVNKHLSTDGLIVQLAKESEC